ncbi:MAG: orotidine-5'-phosphate decarboxylase [Chloroflexi bacterium]|nr:orotidine-5'-phosphate decarboxylase [Chloroflexota bacterium]
MTTNRFLAKLDALFADGRAPLCVGLDPHPARMPARYPDLLSWNLDIISATRHLAACYKPNIAFYEAQGLAGYELLHRTLKAIPAEIPVLLDAKRGDIGSTAQAYAQACFEMWDVDAVTLSPYLGGDSIRPFTAYQDRYSFVLCHTSNPSAGELQQAQMRGKPLYQALVELGSSWGKGNLGWVVGATYPQALAQVRALDPYAWLLAPGVGAQGGDIQATLAAGLRKDGRGVLINVSRGIATAEDPQQAAQAYARQMLIPAPTSSPDALSPRLRTLVLKLFDLDCIRFGEFTLASGLSSPVYIDLRLLSGDPATLALAAQVYADLISGLEAERLAGVPYAALPIATALSLETRLPLIYPRKEAKHHGRGQMIEGGYTAGDRVIVIEDLVTTAGSLIRSIETLRAAGLQIQHAAVLIDREQGGPENLAQAGVQLHAALTFSQILDILHQNQRISAAQVATVRRYLAE